MRPRAASSRCSTRRSSPPKARSSRSARPSASSPARATRSTRCSRFTGFLMGMLVHSGERVREGQPIAWLRSRLMQCPRIVGMGHGRPRAAAHQRRPRATLDTNDQWIVERTGIRERRVAGPDETRQRSPPTRGRGRASSTPGVDPTTIDLLVSPPPRPTSCRRRGARAGDLGLRCGSFDLDAACAGFVYALVVAARWSRPAARAPSLVVGAETLSPHRRPPRPRHRDPLRRRRRRGRARAGGGPGYGVLGWDLGCDGSAAAHPRGPTTGEQFVTWTARRSSAGPCASASTRPRTRWSAPGVAADDIDAVRAPPGQRPHHRRRRRAPRHPERTHGRQHRPLRQHLGRVDPARAGRSRDDGRLTTATSCCCPASVPA